MVRAKPYARDPDFPWIVRTVNTLLLEIRKKCELETESDLEIQDSERENDNLLEPKTSSTYTGTVNANVEAIWIDDNQVNSKSTGNGNIGLDKTDLSVRKNKRTPSKRKELHKVSRELHFNDIPLTPVDRLKIPSGGFKSDQSVPMIEFLRLRHNSMEEEIRKRLDEREDIKREIKRKKGSRGIGKRKKEEQIEILQENSSNK